MRIYDMFAKKIDRPITGVIKVGQITDSDKKQELEEYVVTRELRKHFRDFFGNYARSIDTPTDEMGVWISGFFGSGKSHFLKILSYILDNTVVDGRNAIDYFRDKDNLKDNPTILADMERAAHTPTQAILFNVDSKSTASAKSDSNAIVMVFNRVFNEKLGYDGANPALADLERTLDEEGNYQKFKDTFKELNGKDWLEERNKFRVIRGKVAKTLAAMGRMSEQEAMDWTKAATTSNYEIAIEDFAERVHQYIEKSGQRVVFLVDEIGQFISTDSRLMLNLQTMTEELGTRCHGKAWIVVTAQEDIDSMMENMDASTESRNDFSKIQGRFKTRLSLTSVNADEVIRERILKKNDIGESTLKALYDSDETRIQNAVVFKGNGYEMRKLHSADEFAAVYPFLPYQFHLLADVLNSIRLNSASGKHLSEGERSMLGAFQEAAKKVEDKEEGVLIPFYSFYDNLLKFLDHTHASVIQRAEDSDRINPLHEEDCFAVNVLKTLFLLKYIDGIPLTVDNIMNFMVTDIHEDKAVLRQKVEESLQLLTRSLLVAQIQDTYEFLTDEEQDINRAIRDRNIQQGDVIAALTKMTFDSIYPNARYRVPKFNGRYTFGYNQFVDNRPAKNSQNNPITLRIVTPKYTGSGSVIGTDDSSMAILSTAHEVVMRLPNDNAVYYRDMQNALKIEDYIRNVADPQKGKSTIIRATKMQEAGKAKNSAIDSMKEAIGSAELFINGAHVTDIHTHDAVGRINEALGRLVGNIYYKLDYITKPEDDIDIKNLFRKDNQMSLDIKAQDEENRLAVKEVQEYIHNVTSAHTMISMKSILDSFSKPPYGYQETDTKWMVAKLFKEGIISATVDKEPVTLFNRQPEELTSYFTSRRYDEKILFRAKPTIDQQKIKAVRDIIKALFNHTEVSADADKVMATFKHDAENLIREIQGMLEQQRYVPQFPGRGTLESAARQLSGVSGMNEEASFFDWVYKHRDDFLDLAEDLAPVITFYNSDTQRSIFQEKGLKALKLYENSKEHITDPEIRKVVEQIRDIVTCQMPYERIKDLPNLYQQFIKIYGRILDEKLEPVKVVIDSDRQTALNALEGQPFEEQYKGTVLGAFADLSDRAGKQNDISDMLGFKDKADSLLKTYLDKFARLTAEAAAKASEKKGNPVTPEDHPDSPDLCVREPKKPYARKTKNLMVSDLTSNIWVIKDERSLNQYMDQLRDRIEKELDSDTDIVIRF